MYWFQRRVIQMFQNKTLRVLSQEESEEADKRDTQFSTTTSKLTLVDFRYATRPGQKTAVYMKMTLTTHFIMSQFCNALSVQTTLNLNSKPKQMKNGDFFFCILFSSQTSSTPMFRLFKQKSSNKTEFVDWRQSSLHHQNIGTFVSISYQPRQIQKSLIRFLQSLDMPVFPKVRKQSHKFLKSGDSGPVVIRR